MAVGIPGLSSVAVFILGDVAYFLENLGLI